MWFGTKDYSRFITTPQTGAEVSPQAWASNGTLLNGQGYAMGSFGSHKEYSFAWANASARENAQLMKSFFDGSFGRGKIYFQDPLTLNMNVLPARWADPSNTANYEGSQLVPGVNPTTVPSSGFEVNQLPVRSAVFNLNSVSANPTLTDDNALFIPIPDGMQLNLGAFYSTTLGTAGVKVTTATAGGAPTATTVTLTPLASSTETSGFLPNVITKSPGITGVYLWIGKSVAANATVTVTAIHARLSPVGRLPTGPRTWVGGQGNAGVRFAGPPTYINNTGVNGGQVGYAATFIESVL